MPDSDTSNGNSAASNSAASSESKASRKRRAIRWTLIGLGVVIAALLVVIAITVIPILTHQNQGASHQQETGERWPTAVSARGDDGRNRTLTVTSETGTATDTSALSVGEKLVVKGAGFNAAQGIYVAICVIPEAQNERPGPCIGGVPDQEQTGIDPNAVQWAPSNWINDDWAWKLFGARSFDDVAAGTFTAYLLVGNPADDGLDCAKQHCAIVTRNDHTALGDRVQDVRIPVAFSKAG